MLVLGLVPARGGSKGVPGKNVRPLAGHTLLEYTARAARESSVVELPRHLSPDYVMRIDGGRLTPFLPEGARVTRRQDARPAYSRDGTVYAFWRTTLERFGSIYGETCQSLVLDASDSLNIDTQRDWDRAEQILLARHSGI